MRRNPRQNLQNFWILSLCGFSAGFWFRIASLKFSLTIFLPPKPKSQKQPQNYPCYQQSHF